MGFMKQTCGDFAEALASKAPVPGGGGASALVGALSAALGSMVGNLTVGRKKYAAVETDIYAMLEKLNPLRERLLALVDEDAEAFEPLAAAYAIPKDSPERGTVMEDALTKACSAPLEMMLCCCEVISLLDEMLEKGSAMLVSDVGVGAVCGKAALIGASMNIFINTRSMADKHVAESFEKKADDMLVTYCALADRISAEVTRRIRKDTETAKILKGAPVAEALTEAAARETAELKKRGVVPVLAIVRVGQREDDLAYERGAVKRCEKAGVQVKRVTLAEDCTEAALITALQELNGDAEVHGVLLFRPLPKHMDDERVRNTLAPEKDIDGITDASLAGVFTGGAAGYPPCTAQACVEILDFYGISPKGRRAVVIGRSLVVGKPVAMMLQARHATVTMCHTRTADMPAVCRTGEIIVASAGKAGFVNAEYLAPGQIVLDVGINVLEDGSIRGDVDCGAAGIVEAITPVPGGVGTVTAGVLARHVTEAAAKAAGGKQ
jgi:methylenetetrahydrofolate dehydrogenase (NADP+)/methenyltetrahydrofolate cyclohydrolase